jgi:hypothetical protein
MRRSEAVACAFLVGIALMGVAVLVDVWAGAPPRDCGCAKLDFLAEEVEQAVETAHRGDVPDAGRLEKALSYVVGPCDWREQDLVCSGSR